MFVDNIYEILFKQWVKKMGGIMLKSINFIVFMTIAMNQLWATEANTFAEAKSLATELNMPILMDFWSDN